MYRLYCTRAYPARAVLCAGRDSARASTARLVLPSLLALVITTVMATAPPPHTAPRIDVSSQLIEDDSEGGSDSDRDAPAVDFIILRIIVPKNQDWEPPKPGVPNP